MIEVDQLFVDMFGDFAVYARIIITFWILFYGLYLLLSIPKRKRKSLAHEKIQTRLKLIMLASALAIAGLLTGIYLISK